MPTHPELHICSSLPASPGSGKIIITQMLRNQDTKCLFHVFFKSLHSPPPRPLLPLLLPLGCWECWIYLVSALLYVSAPSGQIFPLQLWPPPQDPPLSSYLLPELLCQHMALVPIWNAGQTHFLGPGPAPALSCPALVGIPTVAPILPVNPTGSPPEPQHSSAFNSVDPPSFLPISPTSASLVLPGEAQLNHLPFVGKRQHQPAGRLRSGGHLGRIMPDFSRVNL